jgi:hypothetical protein
MTHAQTHIEFEDAPIPEIEFSGDVEYQPAEPDVGIFQGRFVASMGADGMRIGQLHLSRDQLLQALTTRNTEKARDEAREWLERLEELASKQAETEAAERNSAWAAE